MHSDYASLRRSYHPSRKRLIIASSISCAGIVVSIVAGAWILTRGSLTGMALAAALILPVGLFGASIFGLLVGALLVRWPRTFRRINRRIRRSNRRRLGINLSRYPILYRWRRLRQTSRSAWTLRAIAVSVPLGFTLAKPAMLVILKGLSLVPAFMPIARALLAYLHQRPPMIQSIAAATAISLGLFMIGVALYAFADILADRTARRASARPVHAGEITPTG